ncbi:hypothetical protein ACSFA7_06335 [Variovorax sp. LT1R20]|uniref:hypothetical protein n=1 Tax=Variovorax sp. LT1R20 TaxID=3443729 RepID=UPI003F45E591
MVMLVDAGGGNNAANAAALAAARAAAEAAARAAAEARARELQRQLEEQRQKLIDAQRQAEQAQKRAVEAQKKAQEAKQKAEAAEAQRAQSKATAEAAQKAAQDAKLMDARARNEGADAALKNKDVSLLKAQIAQKEEEVKSPGAKASAETAQKAKDAQAQRDSAKRTSDLSKLYADSQEKESKAQDAEAKLAKLTPPPSQPPAATTEKDRAALTEAQTSATSLRADARTANTRFTTAIGTQAQTEFYGSPPATTTTIAPQLPAAPAVQTVQATPVIGTDPLHSPLLQLLQVSPRSASTPNSLLLAPTLTSPDLKLASFPPPASTTPAGSPATVPASPFISAFSKPQAVTPEVTKTLSAIADGKSVDQIARERNISADKVIAEANAAGIRIESSKPSTDVEVTTVKKGDASLSYTNDYHSGSVTVNSSFADPAAPGGRKTAAVTQDGNGLLSQTVKDEKTGNNVTHVIDTKAGTRTDSTIGADGKRTETTTDLTGAPVLRPVEEGEGYLDVAKAAGLTPEQLLALNPDVDYGKALKPGQNLVVAGVPTTVKTFNADGTSLEKKTAADGSLNVVATSASGRRTVLMGEPEARSGTGEAARKAIFDDKKSVAEVAKNLGLTPEQVLAALPAGTVDVRPASADNGGIETRTIFDPTTNRTVIETHDPRHDRDVRQVVEADAAFQVRQFNTETGKYEIKEVKGGIGYAQQQADQKLASVGDYDKQITKLNESIRLYNRMGEPTTELQAQRRQLVSQRATASGEADIAQGKAASALTKRQQVVVDTMASNAYQRLSVARPGSAEFAAATKDLDEVLALSDRVDRLVPAADKDVDFLKAQLDKQQKGEAKVQADQNLQTEFEKWKDDVWMWQGIDPKTAEKMKAEGQKPATRIFHDAKQEHDIAWEAFEWQQKHFDKYGDKDITAAERPARDAWLRRNEASDAEQRANIGFSDASIAKQRTDINVKQGDIDRLQEKKNAWVKANPDAFSETFAQQGELDKLNDDATKLRIGGLVDGEDKKHSQFLLTLSARDRADPEALKEAESKYSEDNKEASEKLSQQIDDLQKARTFRNAKLADDYIAAWNQRNPELKKQLDDLGQTMPTSSVRAAEARQAERDRLMASTPQGLQLKAALGTKYEAEGALKKISEDDVARVQKDLEGIDKGIESQTWLRDVFSNESEDAQKYTKEQLDRAKQLKNDLASGKISASEYARQQNEFMDGYGLKSLQVAEDLQDSNETWSVVDDAVRMTVSAAAGIAATIATGGNVAVGFAVGVGVNQLWDTAGDVVAAAKGRDIYADGHSSLLTLGYKWSEGEASWDDVKFTLKDEAFDIASSAVTATGVGAGIRTSIALTSRIAAKEGIDLTTGATLRIGGRAAVGTRAGLVSQAVDGTGRVGAETMRVGLDGKLGTEEGNKRISGTAVSSLMGVATAPLTGAISGAVPLKVTLASGKSLPGVGIGAQFLNDGVSSLGTGELIAQANEGRHMNTGEIIAASLQAIPGTLNNVALHPYMAQKAIKAKAAQEARDAQKPEPPAGPTLPVVPPVEINTPTRNLPGLKGRGADRLVLVDVKDHEIVSGLDTQTRAAAALAPGGVVEFRVARDTQKTIAPADPLAARGPNEEARLARQHEEQQDQAIRVRLRGVGLDNVKIVRDSNPGAKQPEIIVQATKPMLARTPESPFARPAIQGNDPRLSYLTGDEMVGVYGGGTQHAYKAPPDFRVALTMRNRLNVGEYAPFMASPTMQSMSVGIGTRSKLSDVAGAVYDSILKRSMTPLKDALGTQASVAVRPDEYRRTSFLQWGVMPFSRDTIFTVFAKDLINVAKQELFGKGTPGYGVNMRSAEMVGNAHKGPGRVVEVELSPTLDAKSLKLAEGDLDFFGGKADETPGGHVKVDSSLLFDRVIEDLRFSPLLPVLKKALDWTGVPTPSFERRWQMMLKDAIGEGDIVPTRFFEQFQKTFADAKYKLQIVVPERASGRLHDPAELQVRDFIDNPDPAKLKDLVDKGMVDPKNIKFFIPEHGGNHHRTSVPGKVFTESFTDLAGRQRRVADPSTSNVWVIYADNKLERAAQRGIYNIKKAVYNKLTELAESPRFSGLVPDRLVRSRPSTHHVPGQGNLIDSMTGGRGRPDATPSSRRTFVVAPPKLFDVTVLAGSAEVRFQAGKDAPKVAKSVKGQGTEDFKVSSDSSNSVKVPDWFPRVLERALNGPTPVIPKGGKEQLGKFFDDLESKLEPAQRDVVIGLREKHLDGKNKTIGDGLFLRRPVAQDIVDVLTGLRPDAEGGRGRASDTIPRGLVADVPRRADLTYLDGNTTVTVNGRQVSARDIQVAVSEKGFLVMADEANMPSTDKIAADMRAAGYPPGKDVVLYVCRAGERADPTAPVPASRATELGNKLGARVHAVDGTITLGEKITLQGQPVRALPNLPLLDGAHTDPNLAAQQRFWLEPGKRADAVEAPFGEAVRNKGAKVDDEGIDPLRLGIEDRVVDMHPMDAENARAVFPLIAKELGVSPEYNALGAKGMIDKWLGEIANGTRYARVIYPAAGSTPASDAPIGMISVHKEALLGDSYRNTLPAALYRGSKPAGETSKEALQARGEVWQFSTYLGANKNRYPDGVVNKSARMQFMNDVMRQEAAKGAPVEAFYSRVNGGAPFITGSDGVTVALEGHKFNVKSAFSQESQTVGRGPIAVGYEDSSPFKSADFPDGEPARHIYIYETDASLYGPEGKGTIKWRGKIEDAFDKVPGSRSLLAPMRPADLNYLEGEATVKGQPVSARDIELAVPPDSILVMAERGNPPSAERIAADLRAKGYPEGKDVVLYLCEGGTPARANAPVPESLARELSNKIGARVHAVDGDIVLGARNTVEGAPVVQRPNLPLTDVSQKAPHLVTPDADFDAQQRFWLEAGGRTQEAQAPFSQKVLDQGATAGDKSIDPLHLGTKDGPVGSLPFNRAVELVPFDAQHARDVLPYLANELKYSPDYMQLGAEGLAKKWIKEIEVDKTRLAYVIYPPPGSATERRPIGIIAVHKDDLVGDNYVETRDPSKYAGEVKAGALGEQELRARGKVWQFSTYLSEDRATSRTGKSPFPNGVVNSAAKKLVMDAALAELANRKEPIDAFYARVHAGAPEEVPTLGWDKTVNAKSLDSQARMAGGGPLAVVQERGPRLPNGETPTRYVAIFETPVSRYADDGPGTQGYHSLIDAQVRKDTRSYRWVGPEDWQGRPLVHRPANLNYLEGNATANGRPVPARDIEVAVPEKAFVVMADEANVPSLERIAADMRAAGYADGQEVALYICRAGQTADPAAPVPQSLALQLSDKLGARVHAVEGTITLGEKTNLGEGHFVAAQPKLPLMDVSNGRTHANENFDAQQRYWLAPNGRGERVDAPLGAEVRNMGARVGEGHWIDPFVLGIEERVVRLEQFSDRNAPAVLASLTRQLAVSPDFNNLGPEGMARKWQQEMTDGTRMAYVVYPAEGSPLGAKPLGIIALHREALIDGNYVKTLPASYYRAGKFEAGEVPREALLARGDVWQFSTYLNADAKQVPGTNKAGKMLTIEEAAAEGKRRGEEVLAFYARVHGGGPLVLMEPHVNPNIPSLFGQESMARRGPIAVGLEQGSPVTGGADRYVLIFETDRGLYLSDGAGRAKWTADIQKLVDDHPDPGSWLGADPQATSSTAAPVAFHGASTRPASIRDAQPLLALTPEGEGVYFNPHDQKSYFWDGKSAEPRAMSDVLAEPPLGEGTFASVRPLSAKWVGAVTTEEGGSAGHASSRAELDARYTLLENVRSELEGYRPGFGNDHVLQQQRPIDLPDLDQALAIYHREPGATRGSGADALPRLVTAQTRADLIEIRRALKDRGVQVDDLQFLVSENGRPLIHDPEAISKLKPGEPMDLRSDFAKLWRQTDSLPGLAPRAATDTGQDTMDIPRMVDAAGWHIKASSRPDWVAAQRVVDAEEHAIWQQLKALDGPAAPATRPLPESAELPDLRTLNSASVRSAVQELRNMRAGVEDRMRAGPYATEGMKLDPATLEHSRALDRSMLVAQLHVVRGWQDLHPTEVAALPVDPGLTMPPGRLPDPLKNRDGGPIALAIAAQGRKEFDADMAVRVAQAKGRPQDEVDRLEVRAVDESVKLADLFDHDHRRAEHFGESKFRQLAAEEVEPPPDLDDNPYSMGAAYHPAPPPAGSALPPHLWELPRIQSFDVDSSRKQMPSGIPNLFDLGKKPNKPNGGASAST